MVQIKILFYTKTPSIKNITLNLKFKSHTNNSVIISLEKIISDNNWNYWFCFFNLVFIDFGLKYLKYIRAKIA